MDSINSSPRKIVNCFFLNKIRVNVKEKILILYFLRKIFKVQNLKLKKKYFKIVFLRQNSRHYLKVIEILSN
jgi:hypothetical protein